MIQFTTKITLEDFQDFNLYVYKQRWAYKFMKLVGFLFIFLFVSMLILSFQTNERVGWSSYGILFFALVYLFGMPLLIKFNSKKAYETHKMLREKVSFQIDDEAILMKGESYESSLSWGKVYKVVENNRSIFVFHNKQSGNLLPKRAMSNPQLDELRTMIQSKTGFSKKLKGLSD